MKNSKIKNQIAKLIDLKSFITIALIGGVVYGYIAEKKYPPEFINLVTMIVTFYFTKNVYDKGGKS